MENKKYIDSQKFWEKLNSYIAENADSPANFLAGIETAQVILEKFPAEDVKQVQHGHWIAVDDNPYEYTAECSVCHNQIKQPTCMLKPIYSYCPVCGSLMNEHI